LSSDEIAELRTKFENLQQEMYTFENLIKQYSSIFGNPSVNQPQSNVFNAATGIVIPPYTIKIDGSNSLGIFDSNNVETVIFPNHSSVYGISVNQIVISSGLYFNTPAQIQRYAGISSTGLGVPAEYGTYSTVGNAALVSNAINYPPPAAAGIYLLYVWVNVRTAAAVNMSVTVTYKDGASVARSEAMVLLLQNISQTPIINMNNVLGRFVGFLLFQIDNSATAITVSTTGTTQTLYDLAANLFQVA